MRNADSPAQPTLKHEVRAGLPLHKTDNSGLTKREMFAMHVMGHLITAYAQSGSAVCAEKAAEDAAKCADALLKELSK